ncbi:GH3 auxin-responsive promoter family protein [Streptomyces sp. NPDC002734]|uniref:GH3 family domain-containing protein n=1 Tax=Streptomyces sp. NPDC002734 TaxID=3154426 RepID=UPI0033256DB2
MSDTRHWQRHWHARRAPFAEECRQARDGLLADLADPARSQQRVLEDVVALCRDSLHWREQGYDTVGPDAKSFREVLPIRRYDHFAPELEREARTKGGVLSCSPVMRWLKTSGTTGVPKRVPYTLHWLLKYRVPAMRAMWGTYLRLQPAILGDPYATLDTQTVHDPVGDHLHGVRYQSISNRHPRINSQDWNPPWAEAPWFGTQAPSSHTGRMYHRVRHLVGRRMHLVTAINPSTLVSLRDLIAEFGADLVRDLESGTLEGRPYDEPRPEAARHLRSVLAQDAFTLADVWPTLGAYSCWLSSSAGLYRSKLDAVLPGTRALPFMSCGTEGVTTVPVDDTLDSQPLAVNQAFFEFVPAEVDLGRLVDAGERVDTLLLDEVTAGRDYHLVMTQANGLYRLWSGDIYRVDRVVDGVPWIHFVHRDGVFHSFTGEKLTEAQVAEAVEQALAGAGLSSGLYLCGPRWGEPPHYVVVAEVPRPGAALDERLSHAVDQALGVVNLEYASKRVSGRLAPLEFRTVAPDAVATYTESRRQPGNATQYKYRPFQQDTEFVADLLGGVGAHP